MADDRKLHIVMFPWLAFGHIIPFFELSDAIARKGHKISFISTPRNIDRLQKLRPNVTSSMNLVKIPLTGVEGLPENAEATMDIGFEEVDCLKKAYDLMEPAVAQFLKNSGADAIVYDFSAHWVAQIAIDLGILRVLFCIVEPWLLAWIGRTEDLINGFEGRRAEDFMIAPEWVTFHTKVALRYHEAAGILGFCTPNSTGISDGYRAGVGGFKSDAIILRHCYEFDTEWFSVLPNLYPKQQVMPLGFLPPRVEETKEDDSESEKWISVKKWLDTQAKDSVLYIGFGTEVTPNQDQLNELAHGLELSGVPFLWAFRRPALSMMNKINLPEGFEERVKGRGVVWRDWAPQSKILKHDSVGAFLTHCGTTSIFEALMFGLPLVMLPIVSHLWLSARVLEEKQLGLEIPSIDGDRSIARDSVAQGIRMVMVEDGGKKFRDKAKEVRALLGDGETHDRYLDRFMEYLLSKCIC